MLEGAGALILLVEDDPANMLLTRTVLEDAGHRILAATTLFDARELLELEHPDLVITDVDLHGESGLELVQDVRENPRLQDVPVVALTAHAMPEMADEVFDAGCADYITKPVDITQLVRRVNANLALARTAGLVGPHRSSRGGRTA
ncbi:MAG TPA: response regulator [Candidatus Dormibacteraeota bacterium]|jgi:CheY-like chemotaxis protein